MSRIFKWKGRSYELENKAFYYEALIPLPSRIHVTSAYVEGARLWRASLTVAAPTIGGALELLASQCEPDRAKILAVVARLETEIALGPDDMRGLARDLKEALE